MANNNIAIWLVVGLLAVFILFPDFNLSSVTKTAAEVQIEQAKVTEDVLCPPGSDPSNTMTLGPIKQKWAPTTSMTSINSRIFEVSQKADGTYDTFKASNDLGSKADSTTLTVGGKDKIGIIYGYDGAGAVNYYGRWVEVTAPCKPFQTGSYDSGSNELIQNASSGITFTIKNSDTGLVQDFAGTQNETIGTAEYGYFDFTQVQTVEKEGISAGTDRAGNVGNVIVTVEVNGTMYDEEVTTFGSLVSAVAPSFYTVANTDSKVRAFTTKGCPDPRQESVKFCQENWGRLAVKAASGVNPYGDNTGTAATEIGLGNVKVCLFDQDYALNTKTGEPIFAYENDAGTAIGKFGSTGLCVILDVQ